MPGGIESIEKFRIPERLAENKCYPRKKLHLILSALGIAHPLPFVMGEFFETGNYFR